jgi:hypothetical protein
MSIRIRGPAWRKIGLALVVLVGAAAASEIGMRLWLRARGEPYDRERTLQRLEDVASATSAYVPPGASPPKDTDFPRFLLHPYTGAEAWHDTGGVLEYFRTRERPDHYKVLVTGGSVATRLASSLRSKLPELMRDDPALAGRKVAVLNYAHASYKQPQQLMRLAYLLSFGYRPDAVVEIDGFNEVTFGPENAGSGGNPLYPAAPVWAAHARRYGPDTIDEAPAVARILELRESMHSLAREARRSKLGASCWVGRAWLSRMERLNDESLALQRQLTARSREKQSDSMHRQIDGPDFDPDPKAVMAASVRCWLECADSMQALCAARGIRYVHVLQPTLYDLGSKPMSAEEAALPLPSKYWRSGPRDGYPLLRARIDELRARGVRFLDQSRVFAGVTETLYKDTCHLNERGEEIWIERMFPELRAALLGP